MTRAFVFAALVSYTLYISATVDTRERGSVPMPVHVFEPIGASMRERNERAAIECAGTVAQRRACWLRWPTAR